MPKVRCLIGLHRWTDWLRVGTNGYWPGALIRACKTCGRQDVR